MSGAGNIEAAGSQAGWGLEPEIYDWLQELTGEYRVIVPSLKGGNRIFQDINDQGNPMLGLPQERTVLPIKKLFLPPEEALLEFGGDTITPGRAPEKQTVVFGLHVCELSASRLLTTNMADDRADYPYLARRQGALLAGVSCRRTQGCFCEKTAHDRAGPGDFDLFLELGETDDDGGNGGGTPRSRLIAGTAAGRELARRAPFPVDGATEVWAPPPDDAGRWPIDRLPDMMRKSFGAPMWDEPARRCLGCGNCTVVCPLCYCFYTRDETGLDPGAGSRLRHWDSCQLVAFARVAGGHNFREARSERIWYRFSHKFMRTQEKFGLPGCSGCGACAHFCPVDIDPRQIIGRLLEVSAGG